MNFTIQSTAWQRDDIGSEMIEAINFANTLLIILKKMFKLWKLREFEEKAIVNSPITW